MGRGVVLVGCLVAAMLACLGGAAATEYVVGDSRGWTASPNITTGYYNEWAAGKTFTGGDSLKFVSNESQTVAIVTKEEYDNCTEVASWFGIGAGFRFTLPADANGPFYFISTIGSNCENGLKLAINVTSLTPAEAPNSSASSVTVGVLSMLVLVSSSIIAMFLN